MLSDVSFGDTVRGMNRALLEKQIEGLRIVMDQVDRDLAQDNVVRRVAISLRGL